MNDAPHVRFVYAQAEGDRRHHHAAIIQQKALLRFAALPRVQACVVKADIDSFLSEQLMRRRRFLARGGINDGRAGFAFEQFDQPPIFFFAGIGFNDFQMQIRAVEIGYDSFERRQGETGGNVVLDFGRGSGRDGQKGCAAKFGQSRQQRAVMRAKIVSPLADAMRFIITTSEISVCRASC